MATADPLIGTRMGDYVIESLLGRGGMARVYRGYDSNLDRYAAVKVIDSHLIASDEADEYYERFQREARSIARLRHPNIVSVYQFGQVQDEYYMAMVFIEGRDLRQLLKEHIKQGTLMAPALVMKIMRAMATALDYAHSEGVIHRDVKPSNILVTADGTAVLTDFGLALSVPEGTVGNTFGSAHYIAPEQAISSAQAVPQSDLYSLGICLYEMLTGRLPFDDASAMSVALKHLSEPPPPPSKVNPKISPYVESVVQKLLEKEPEDRYESGKDFIQALERAYVLGEDDDTHKMRVGVSASIPRPRTDLDDGDVSEKPTTPPIASVSRSASLARNTQSIEQVSKKLAPDPARADGRGGLMIGGGVAAVLVAAILVLLALSAAGLIGGVTEETPTPTETTIAVVSSDATDTVEIIDPTSTSRSRPTQDEIVATDPLATDAPPSASATRIVSPTPTPTEPDATTVGGDPNSVNILLRYDDRSLTLYNASGEVVNVNSLVFVKQVDEDTQRRVRVSSIWTRGEVSPRALPPGDCYQVWTTLFSILPAPGYCTRQAYYGVQPSNDFWIGDEAGATFDVMVGQDIVATCEVSVGECSVPVRLSSP